MTSLPVDKQTASDARPQNGVNKLRNVFLQDGLGAALRLGSDPGRESRAPPDIEMLGGPQRRMDAELPRLSEGLSEVHATGRTVSIRALQTLSPVVRGEIVASARVDSAASHIYPGDPGAVVSSTTVTLMRSDIA